MNSLDLPKLERPKNFSKGHKKMELIEPIFAQLHADIQSRLKLLERQVIAIVANANRENVYSQDVKDDVQRIKDAMKAFQERVNKLESSKVTSTPVPVTSAGLEGILVRPLTLPSPILAPSTSNSVIMPMRSLVIQEAEEDTAEPDEEAMVGEMAEQMGGIDAESEEEEQDEEKEEEQDDEQEEDAEEEADDEADEEEGEEEQPEEEVVELNEFIWKGKTYGITPDNKVHRLNEEGEPEDEPFAQYDAKNNRLVRI